MFIHPKSTLFSEAIATTVVTKLVKRETLRAIARTHNIPRGRNAVDTAINLINAGVLNVQAHVIYKSRVIGD